MLRLRECLDRISHQLLQLMMSHTISAAMASSMVVLYNKIDVDYTVLSLFVFNIRFKPLCLCLKNLVFILELNCDGGMQFTCYDGDETGCSLRRREAQVS